MKYMNKVALSVMLSIFLISLASASSDIQFWQGQYTTGTTYNLGVYSFNFTIYDALTGGTACYTNTTSLSMGFLGQWSFQPVGVLAACSSSNKDYYLNIRINGADQTPRRYLTLIGNYTGYDLQKSLSFNHTAQVYADHK